MLNISSMHLSIIIAGIRKELCLMNPNSFIESMISQNLIDFIFQNQEHKTFLFPVIQKNWKNLHLNNLNRAI